MKYSINTLRQIIKELKKNHVACRVDEINIDIHVDPLLTDFTAVKPFLYSLVNRFEDLFTIVIYGLPYCLMPDAAHHMARGKWWTSAGYERHGECRGCKYRSDCPGFLPAGGKTGREKPVRQKDIPEETVLEITQKCNMDCPLCFRNHVSPDMEISRVMKVIDECVITGIHDIRFTGGEPFLYEDLETALEYARKKRMYITINTNATLLGSKNLSVLLEYADNVLIPLQGFDPDSERRLTKFRVDLAEKIGNIMKLSKRIPLVRVGTIISKTLCAKFDKYYRLIREAGINHWELYRPMTNENINEFRISRRSLVDLMEIIKNTRKKGEVDVRILNPVPFCITGDMRSNQYVLFGAEKDEGHSRIIIDGSAIRPGYSMKKYFGNDMLKAWNDPFLKKMRSLEYLPARCRDCFYLKWCKGGSRFQAKLHSGSYFGKDPLMGGKTV